ncbi:unnamed protein product [Ceratitis capitata]|uniref:(Mediterranean fruit fly) hypothetical protein n=1 Tax=Ceratitis capitata TaxID=7213 RepID=A0A811URW3_CERCA|nr:unnamed protein product [Ceratitis capitata]
MYLQKWTEWKSDVQRKLAQNKAELKATGGGPFSKLQLTQTGRVIVRICGMTKSVVSVASNAIGLPNDRSGKRLQLQAIIKARPETTVERLKKTLMRTNPESWR